MVAMVATEDPYVRLCNPNVGPYIRLTAATPQGGIPKALRSQQPSKLAKQQSLSCEVLHFSQDSDHSDEMNIDNSLQALRLGSPHHVLGSRITPNSGTSQPSSESDVTHTPSLLGTPRPSHDSEGDTTDSELPPPEVRFREDVEHARAGPSQVFEATFEYNAASADELTLKHGSIVKLVTKETGEPDWFCGEVDGRIGLFPANYATEIGIESRRIPASEIVEGGLIGNGATANVYRADWNGTKIALKKPLNVKEKMEEMKREAVMFNRLKHENIVKLYGICLEAPHVGLVLELCEGDTLASVYKRVEKSYVSARILVEWAIQIASGMRHLAQHKFIHRDLKADNVLVKSRVCFCELRASTPTTPTQSCTLWAHPHINSSGTCDLCGGQALDQLTLKITDFGLTREASDKRQSVAGTAAWMAPEAYRSKAYSEASDVWSFGVTLWELLTRKTPYEGMEQQVILYFVALQKASLPIGDECPQTLREILESCWKHDPKDRPTFAQIHDRLTDYRNVLMKEGVSNGEEESLQKARFDIINDLDSLYVSLRANQDQEKVKAEYERLMQMQCDMAASESQKAIAEANMIKTAPPRRSTKKKKSEKKKKIGKIDISGPENFQHFVSVRPRTSSHSPHHGSHSNLEVIKFDRDPGQESSIFGTLPKTKIAQSRAGLSGLGKKQPAGNGYATHDPLTSKLSNSSPNLHDVIVRNGAGDIAAVTAALLSAKESRDKSLQRHNGIRKKKKGSTDGSILGLENADNEAIRKGLATPHRDPAKIQQKRRSHDNWSDRVKGTITSFFPWKNRNESPSTSFDEDTASVVSNQYQPSPRSHRSPSEGTPQSMLVVTGQLSRSPAGLAFLGEHHGHHGRSRLLSATDTKSPHSTKNKMFVQPTERTAHFVKHPYANVPGTSSASSSASNTLTRPRNTSGAKHSPIGIDDAVPTTPPDDAEQIEFTLRHMRNSSSDASTGGRGNTSGYEMLANRNHPSNHTVTTNGYDRLQQASHIPTSHPTHERMPFSLSDVVPAPGHMSARDKVVTNGPYISMVSSAAAARPLSTTPTHPYTAQPPQFGWAVNQSYQAASTNTYHPYQMLAKPLGPKQERPTTLPLNQQTTAVTPGESGISTAGSSLFSVPMDEAPPPPSSIGQPEIPPRTGAVPL